MNEFLEQFQIEVRELTEQATDDLLLLEQAPGDRECLERVFRAFHTLKGSAGIVDFTAMSRAMHAAEELLTAVRNGGTEGSAALIGGCLACLEQVTQWLVEMAAADAVPAGADAMADRLITRLLGPAADPPRATENADWVDRLCEAHPDAGSASLAIRYVPSADCFFHGDDPLALLAAMPGLRALEVLPVRPWAPLDSYDPFACNIVIRALADATPEQAAAHFSGVRGEVALAPIAPAANSSLAEQAIAVLRAQVTMLQHATGEDLGVRLAAAGRVAGNVLRHSGQVSQARVVAAALADATETLDATPLLAALQHLLQPPSQPVAQPDAAPRRPTAAGTLRVDANRIDAIVRVVGELTVVKNALGHVALLARAGHDPATVAASLSREQLLLDRLTTQLQRSVLEIRVLPMRHSFRRFPPLVRDLATRLGKQVRLEISGEATEADKTVVEALFEPLLHVLRNTLDHGIEAVAGRVAAGKPAVARVGLHSRREGQNVIVEVSDDGAGLDIPAIRRRAEAQGALSSEAVTALSDQAAADLIFTAGLSTATEVTEVSGRGVGMNAVRTAIEQLGGRVAIDSRPGEGVTVRFTLPFSVVMTRVITLETAGQMFGVPFDAVTETLQLPRQHIQRIGATEAFVLRGRTVPLINLIEALGLTPDVARGEPAASATLVVTALDGEPAAFEVDAFHEQLNVMLQPVGGLLAGVRGIAGTTLLGDGRVLIVLDLPELLR